MLNSPARIDTLARLCGDSVRGLDREHLLRCMHSRMDILGCGTADEYFDALAANAEEVTRLLGLFRNNYSLFFRNSLTFAAIERVALPMLFAQGAYSETRELRIWSVGCAAGQETYSLAMLCAEAATSAHPTRRYRIFGSDMCPEQIATARSGTYSMPSLSNVSLGRLDSWFTREGDTFTVKEPLRTGIAFDVLDLLNAQTSGPPSSIFGDFDLVMCANMLVYYSSEFQVKILRRLVRAVAGHGLLIVGEAERHLLTTRGYRELVPSSAIFHI